ncbi:MAG: hypothetical protein M3P04_10995 [Actinomycetota bacterium]|nr:hypothetical protein [Actinomycetota bacterium]
MRYTRDVGPGDVGVRVSLRRRLPEGGYGDVLGIVRTWDETSVQVEKRDGTVVVIEADTVVAAKRVPPPPVRR